MPIAARLKKISKKTFGRQHTRYHSQPANQISKSWLEALPLADVERSTQLLIERASKTLWSRMPYEKRFELLAMLQETIDYLCHMHYQRATENSMSPSQGQKNAVCWILQLRILMASASTTPQQRSSTHAPQKAEERAQCFYWGLTQLEAALVACYQFNLAAPTNLWEKVHRIAKTARDNNLHKYDARAVEQNYTSPKDIDTLYKRILMVALALPDQIPGKNVLILQNHLTLWASEVMLSPYEAQEDVFIVDLNSDAPPSHFLSGTAAETHYLAIHTKALVERLSAEAPAGVIRFPEGLLEHCTHSWTKNNMRRHERVKRDGSLNACVGLSNLHYFISESRGHKNIALPGLNDLPTTFSIGSDSIEAFHENESFTNASDFHTTHGFYTKPEKTNGSWWI